jgi:hypothetical protein
VGNGHSEELWIQTDPLASKWLPAFRQRLIDKGPTLAFHPPAACSEMI